jgi:hypothetical protein
MNFFFFFFFFKAFVQKLCTNPTSGVRMRKVESRQKWSKETQACPHFGVSGRTCHKPRPCMEATWPDLLPDSSFYRLSVLFTLLLIYFRINKKVDRHYLLIFLFQFFFKKLYLLFIVFYV